MEKIGKKGRNTRASSRRKRSFKGNQFTKKNKDVDSSLEGPPDCEVDGEEPSTNLNDQHEVQPSASQKS